MSTRDTHGNACDRRLRIHIRAASDVNPGSDLDAAIASAQSIFGKHGIFVSVASKQSIAIQSSMIPRLAPVYTECTRGWTSQVEYELYERFGVPNDKSITVFLVDSIWSAYESMQGCAAHAPGRAALILASTFGAWSLAHEICHVLMVQGPLAGHSDKQGDLMWEWAGSYTGSDTPTLDPKTVSLIRSSPLLLPC